MDDTAFAYAGLTGNALIDQLGTDVSRRLLAFSRMVRLEARETLYEPGGAARHVFFPAGCVAAACATAGDGTLVEAALVGREGLGGLLVRVLPCAGGRIRQTFQRLSRAVKFPNVQTRRPPGVIFLTQ